MQKYLFDLLEAEWETDADGGGVETAAPPSVSLADARPYQFGWRDAVRAGWLAGRKRLCGVAATGTGKGWGIALFAQDVLDGVLGVYGRQPRPLVIAHRKILVEQLAATLAALFPTRTVEIEMGAQRARGDADIVVACLDSISSARRLRYFKPERYAAAVWDEAHRYGRNDQRVRRVVRHFGEGMCHVGLTATPDRAEGDMEFDDLAFEYDIFQAVDDGYLVKPYIADGFGGDIELERVRVTSGGEFHAGDLSELMASARPLAAAVKAARYWSGYKGGRRPGIITCSGVQHAELAATLLNEWDREHKTGRAAAVHSDMSTAEIDDVLGGFRRGEILFLTHFDCLTEGFDSDLPKFLVNARPCRSRYVFAQGCGRVLRPTRDVARLLSKEPDPAKRRALIMGSDKPGAVICDLAVTGHRLTVDLLDVFRPRGVEDEDVEPLRTTIRQRVKGGKLADPTQDFETMREVWATARAARRDEERDRWRGVLVGTDVTFRMEDPFVKAVTTGREPPWFTGKRPTVKMRNALLRGGIPAAAVDRYTFFQAKRQLDVLSDRRDKGLATYKQVQALRRHDIDAARMSFEEASAELDKLAKARWRKP